MPRGSVPPRFWLEEGGGPYCPSPASRSDKAGNSRAAAVGSGARLQNNPRFCPEIPGAGQALQLGREHWTKIAAKIRPWNRNPRNADPESPGSPPCSGEAPYRSALEI